MTELSPAAQAIDDATYAAWITRDNPRSIAAATLRAVGLQMIKTDDLDDTIADWLYRIAAELEGQA